MLILFFIIISIILFVSISTYLIDKYTKGYLEPKMQLEPNNALYKKVWSILYLLYWCICAGGLLLLITSCAALLYRFGIYVFTLA